MTEHFRTKSILKAAFIEAAFCIRCELEPDADSKAVFVFPYEKRILEAADCFNVNGAIPARTFAQSVGDLRDRCRELRQSSRRV